MKLIPIGTYKVHPNQNDFEYSMSVHHDEEFVRKEMDSVVMVEFEIQGAFSSIEAFDFYQTDDLISYCWDYIDIETNRPFPKKEREYVLFRNDDGTFNRLNLKDNSTETVKEEDFESEALHPVDGSSFRLLFFLSFYDPNEPLTTSYGDIELPKISEIPNRLSWKNYAYWD